MFSLYQFKILSSWHVFLTTCTWNNLSPLTLHYKPRNMTKILEQMEHLFLCVMSNEVNLLVYDLHLKLKRQYKERQLIRAKTLARKGGWIVWRDWPTNCVLTSRIPFLTLHFYWTTVFSLSLWDIFTISRIPLIFSKSSINHQKFQITRGGIYNWRRYIIN